MYIGVDSNSLGKFAKISSSAVESRGHARRPIAAKTGRRLEPQCLAVHDVLRPIDAAACCCPPRTDGGGHVVFAGVVC